MLLQVENRKDWLKNFVLGSFGTAVHGPLMKTDTLNPESMEDKSRPHPRQHGETAGETKKTRMKELGWVHITMGNSAALFLWS